MKNTDALAFDAAPGQRETDLNGYLHVKLTPISKAAVNPYLGREIPGWRERGLKPDEIYYGLRDPTELEAAAASFNGLPVLLTHAPDSAADPQKNYRVGSTGDKAVWEAPYLKNSLHIQDARAIAAIEAGTYKELSAAYFFDPDFTPGSWEGVAYDFIMRNIRGNHVALVKEGRAGHDVAVADASPPALSINLTAKEKDMEELKDPKDTKDTGKAADGAELDLTLPIEALLKQAGDLESAHALIKQLYARAGQRAGDADPEPAPSAEPPAKDADPQTAALLEAIAKLTAALGAAAPAPDSAAGQPAPAPPAADTNALIAAAAKKTEAQILASVRQRNAAAGECRALLGNIDALAFDSAEEIYAKALAAAGIDHKKQPPAAWRGMVAVLNNLRPAMDARPFDFSAQDDKVADSLKNLGQIAQL
jgi:hypothetical protein